MFCPKCGQQNNEDTRFCRGCGADLSGVLAVVEGKPPRVAAADEKYVELYSRGVNGLLLAAGFFIVSGIAWILSPAALIITLFALMFAFAMLATGISRFVQARGLRKLKEGDVSSLPAGRVNYLKPSRSIYETDDLVPTSVTERTTNLLSKDAAEDR